MPFTVDEIVQMLTDGGEINPLEWETSDKLRFCLANIAQSINILDHICRVHLRSEDEGEEGNVEAEHALEGFRELDNVMLLMHNTHLVMQSTLGEDVRRELLEEKISLMTGIPSKVVGQMGHVVLLKMDTAADFNTVEDIVGERYEPEIDEDEIVEAEVIDPDEPDPDYRLEWGGEDKP